MKKRTHEYDNVFKTIKSKHKRLFIAVINDIFGKNYPMNANMDILPSEGYFTEGFTKDRSKEIEEHISDFLIKLENEIYLLECQSYDDGSMAIRIAEYAFIVARQFAVWDVGHAVITMPRFSIIYVKRTDKTPKTTIITFTFPNGQSVNYESENVILDQLTKEYIIEKRLFPYIPFYIARYEKNMVSEKNIDQAIRDLTYFKKEMLRLNEEKVLSDAEIVDLMGFVNTIITHITNGNESEERLVNIMGGIILETETERWMREDVPRLRQETLKRLRQEMAPKVQSDLRQEMSSKVQSDLRQEMTLKVQSDLRQEMTLKVQSDLRQEMAAKVQQDLRQEMTLKVQQELRQETMQDLQQETERKTQQILRKEQAKIIIELGQEDGLEDEIILKRMQEKIGLTVKESQGYMKEYGKLPV